MGVTLRLEDVRHEYPPTEESAAVQALSGVDLRIDSGDFAVLMGPSGSGKSTLLNVIGAVDRPSGGKLHFGDRDIAAAGSRELTLLRRQRIGFVFQFFHLIPTFTVRENVAFPLHLLREKASDIAPRVDAILAEIGLTGRARHYPNELSGGEMQRVAIARAVIHEPDLILADEPTGNLDTKTGDTILELIREIHIRRRPTIVMATHSERTASYGDYVIDVLDGSAARR